MDEAPWNHLYMLMYIWNNILLPPFYNENKTWKYELFSTASQTGLPVLMWNPSLVFTCQLSSMVWCFWTEMFTFGLIHQQRRLWMEIFYNCALALSYSRGISAQCLRIWNWTVDSPRRRNLKFQKRKRLCVCNVSNICYLFCKTLNDNAYKSYTGYNFNKNIFKVLSITTKRMSKVFYLYI